MSSRVLLVSIADDLNPGPTLPLALAHLKASLGQAGIDADTIDLAFEDDRPRLIRERVAAFRPDIVGISIKYLRLDHSRTGSTTEGAACELIDTVKQVASPLFVLGGAGFSTAPEHFLAALPVRYGIVGDGEQALVDFVTAVEQGHEPQMHAVAGLVWKNADGSLGRHRPQLLDDLGALAVPDRSIFDARYLPYGGLLPVNGIQTCRGCSKRCIMCAIARSEGKRERTFAPEQVVAQIAQDQQRGFRGFYIADTVFNRPLRHAHDICDAFLAHNVEGPWAATVVPEGLTLDLVEKMKATGCQIVTIGADAAEPRMLHSLRKDFTVDQLVAALQACAQADLPVILTLWIGGPGESISTVEQSFELVDSLNPDLLLVYYGIQIYPATKLAQIARDEGYFCSEAELLTPTLYESRALPREEFMTWYSQRYADQQRIILRQSERDSISLFPGSANRIGPLIFGSATGGQS